MFLTLKKLDKTIDFLNKLPTLLKQIQTCCVAQKKCRYINQRYT